MNFRGRRLVICVSRTVSGTWESIRDRVTSFSLRIAHKNLNDAFLGGLLNLLPHKHNFTFDAVRCAAETGGRVDKGIISMFQTIACRALEKDCNLPALSFSEFFYFSTVSFSRPRQPQPSKLSSLATPFAADDAAVLMLVGSSICMVILCMERTGKWNVGEALLSVYSSLLGQYLRPSGNPRYLSWHVIWLLVIGFITISYTNVLQSIFVAPHVHHSDFTFEDMLREDLTFEATHFEWMRAYSSKVMGFRNGFSHGNAGAVRTSTIIQRHKQLVERMVEYKLPNPSSWHTVVNTFSEERRKVVVMMNRQFDYLRGIPRKTGWDLVVGKEQFFKFPMWWNFGEAERGSLLAESLERLKSTGLTCYFLDLYDLKVRDMNAARALSDFVAAGDLDGISSSLEGWSRVTLENGLVSESLILWLYGMLFAIAAFVGEIIAIPLTQFLSYLRSSTSRLPVN